MIASLVVRQYGPQHLDERIRPPTTRFTSLVQLTLRIGDILLSTLTSGAYRAQVRVQLI